MTKDKICRMLGYKTYDTALPQSFFDDVQDGMRGEHPWVHFVWVYEDKNGSCGIGGVAGPLTSKARNWLESIA
jgi:hypothetical protein